MRLGREVDHRLRLMLAKQFAHEVQVADIAMHEVMAISRHRRQRLQIAGVGEAVEVDDEGVGRSRLLADIAAADKSGAAGHENGFVRGVHAMVGWCGAAGLPDQGCQRARVC